MTITPVTQADYATLQFYRQVVTQDQPLTTTANVSRVAGAYGSLWGYGWAGVVDQTDRSVTYGDTNEISSILSSMGSAATDNASAANAAVNSLLATVYATSSTNSVGSDVNSLLASVYGTSAPNSGATVSATDSTATAQTVWNALVRQYGSSGQSSADFAAQARAAMEQAYHSASSQSSTLPSSVTSVQAALYPALDAAANGATIDEAGSSIG